ncbi:MAG: TonB-dependent receptor [Deltaproteobacteria bacterium]|nr:TonB-dependent receptor [Deltaproteobacteria bacterium]
MKFSHRLQSLVWLLIFSSGASVVAPQRARAADEAPAPPAPKLTKPPALLTFVEAVYPEEEKAANRSASVVLQVVIGADGKVTEATVSQSAGAAFDAAALAAVKAFVFSPAEIDGVPSPIRILYKYDFVLKAAVKTTADLSGIVRNRKTKKPLPNVAVTVGQAKTTTGPDGRFEVLDVPPGKVAVAFAGPGITASRTEETLEAGKKTDVIYDVSPEEVVDPADKDDLEIVVIAPPLQKAVASIQIAADQGRKLPGTQGDVLKVVESLPGVARSSAGSGQLVVWGASPQDTRVYIDGVRIPALYHTSGLRSVVAGELVKNIELVPGGYGASYGRGLGGIVLVESAALEGNGTHGAATVDLLDAAATVRTPLSSKWRLALSGRWSYLDRVLETVSDEDVGAFYPIPRYRDGQVRLAYVPSKREQIEFVSLGSSDKVTRTVQSPDPALTKRDDRDTNFYRFYMRYSRDLDDGARVSVVPFFGQDRTRLQNQYGGPVATLDTTSTIYGFRGNWRARVAQLLTVTLGLDAEVVQAAVSRTGSPTLPPREGDLRVFGQLAPNELNSDTWNAFVASAAPYAELDITPLGDRLHIIPGIRVEPYVVGASRQTPRVGDTPSIGLLTQDTTVQPRLTARFDATKWITFSASYGQYRQAPQAEDLSAVFGNPRLTLSEARHLVFGANIRLGEKLSAELTAFRSDSHNLAVRSPREQPFSGEALLPLGKGKTVGGQVLLKQTFSKSLFGWVSYSLLRSQRIDPVASDQCSDPALPLADCRFPNSTVFSYTVNRTRLFDYDQTHLLTALASWDIGRGFNLGARFRYATGYPRTPVVGSFYDARRDAVQPLFGAQNSIRIPAFLQADVRLAKTLTLAKGSDLELYLDVQNITNRQNAEEIAYSPDYARKARITGLPLLPVVGARLTW